METPVKSNFLKIIRVARFKRINCNTNHFHHQCRQLNEARGWAGALIWNDTGDYYLLKASAVSSRKLCYITVQYIYKTNLKFFGSPAPLGVSFTCNPTLKIHVLSLLFCKWRIEIKEGKDRRLKVILHGVIHKHDFECYKNVPKMFWVVATLSQHCYPKIRRCKSPRVRSPYWSHNQLQKYLRHCTVFWHKQPVHDLVLVIPPPPIIKVASNGRPYSKLRGTTFNGREEGGQYYTSQPCDQERFFARKVVFS